MGIEKGLGIDNVVKRPVTAIFDSWKRSVIRLEAVSPFSMFYIAGPDEKQAEAIDYLAKLLSIGENDRLTVQAEPGKDNLQPVLEEATGEIRALEGKRILIIAKGFEGEVKDLPELEIYKFGHHWDQDVLDGRLVQTYRDMKKNLVIITTIAFSCGQEVYDKAIRTAISSQFKSGILELEN